jgi:predicted amidohydrolase YtcJ
MVLAMACAGTPESASVEDAETPTVQREAPEFADTIYRGGPVLTVDAEDEVAEALAVRGGTIAAVGDEADVLALRGPNTRLVELGGRALAPGFIDAHGHISQVATLANTVNVASPPVGPVNNIADVQQQLRDYIDRNNVPVGTTIVGMGYDDALLAEQRHPDKFDLDAVSISHPILLLHVSMHLATANTALLEKAGIHRDTPDPPSGVFRRVDGGTEPNGVMEEHAMYAAYGQFPQPSPQEMMAALVEAQNSYAREGFTTAQDGAMSVPMYKLLSGAAAAGALFIDITGYAIWGDYEAVAEVAGPIPGRYAGGFRVAGAKIVLDGSPQGKTAWLSAPYHIVPDGLADDYAGYPAFSDEDAYAFISKMRSEEVPLLAHANGDRAAEQLIDTVERVQTEQGELDWRPVMIHAQALRHDQIARLSAIGMIPSFFVAHTFYWGDWHRDSVFGPERGARISSLNTSVKNNVRFTIHNDAPVVPPKGPFLLWTAVNRITRSGKTLGPDERVTPQQALRAMTIDAAYQAFEQDSKGSLEVGKRADLVVLSESPFDVEPTAIKDIQVIETIKDGRTIFPPAAQ